MMFVKKICLIFLLWILIVCGCFMFLLGTNIGAYFTLTGVTYYIPGFTFDGVSGRWGSFNINHVVYQTSIGTIKIDKCNISLNLKHVWNKQLYIDYLCFQDIVIKIKKNELINKENKKKEILKMSNISFPIIIKNIALYNARIISEIIVVELKKLDASLTFQDNSLIVSPVLAQGGVLNISNANMSDMKMNIMYMYDKYNSNQWNIQDMLNSLSKKLLKTSLSYNFPINITLKNIKGENFYITDNYDSNHYTINDFYLQVYLCSQFLNTKLNIKLPYGYFDILGNMIFQEYYPIDITVAYIAYNYDTNSNRNFHNIKSKCADKINLVISGELYKNICLRCDVVAAISIIHFLLKVNLTQSSIPISISISGSKIPFSFLGKDGHLIEEIDIRFSGEMKDYCIQMTSRLSSTKFSTAYVVMHAKGDVNSCIISKLRVTVLDRYLDMQGVINWGNVISWRNVFVLNKVNIFQEWLKYPIELSGSINVEGFFSFDSWEVTVSYLDINGHIKNDHISCTGILYGNSAGKLKIPELLIKWGPNILEIKGDFIEDFICNVVLKASNCGVIVPGLIGSVYGEFKLYGPVRYPRLLFNVDAHSLCWNDKGISLNKVIINSEIYCDEFMESKIFVQVDDIKYEDLLSLRQVIMKGQGSIKQHCLNLIAFGDMLSGRVKINSNIDLFHKIWRIKIDKTSITTSIGTWKLMQDIDLIYQHLKRKVIINSHYWDIFDCKIPVHNILRINALNKAEELFKNFNITSVKISLPEFIKMRTARLCCTNCCWILGKSLPKGTILFSGTQLNLQSSFEKLKVVSTKVNHIKLNIKLKPTIVYCIWFMNIGYDCQSNGLLKIATSHDASEIIGEIQVKNMTLAFFWDSLILSKESMDGLLNVNVHFHKYAHHLKIYGSVQIQHLNFNEPNTSFFIKNGQLFVRFFGDSAVLNGTIDTDHECRLYLNGNISHFDSIYNIYASLKIQGNQVNFCISPEMKVKMSPDITCIITSKKIYIRGNVEIPWARIEIKKSLKNVVNISSEEILLDDEFRPFLDNSKNLAISVSCNISVYLGNDVHLDGLGLRAKLRGNLEVGYNKGNLVLTGSVDIPSGYFQLYGHNLIIKKGQLLFSGTINQPYIDIEAICGPSRIKDGIIVGLRMTGIFNQPKVEIFSNSSSFSSQQIIHYLLGNKNLILANAADTNIITSLLIGASVKNSEKFINKIGRIFGVKNLELNTQDIGTAPLVALSGYIAPGLQIEYGVSIFDLLTTITARYCLYPQLYLEVASGSNQAFDILYKFDF